jgi:ribonuclease P protein component
MGAAPRGGEDQKLPRARRIRHGSEIRTLVERGKRSRTAHLDVFDSASPVAHPRAGVIVPRHRHTIVERNLLKRRLREILRKDIRPELARTGRTIDVLVRARRQAYGTPFRTLREELLGWMEQRCSPVSSS